MLDEINKNAWKALGENRTKTPLTVPISEIESREQQWLLSGLIPLNVPTLLCGDAGCGKSTLSLSIASAISRNDEIFNGLGPNRMLNSGSGKVLILSNEDDPHVVLRPRLNQMNANCDYIHIPNENTRFCASLYIGSEQFRLLVEEIQPHLLIIDPLQSYVPSFTNMNSKIDMRKIMQELIELGTSLNITTIIISHTNKKQGVGGMYRIADSSEIRNACRNVLIIGEVEKNELYCDHDKCNVGPRCETILFNFDDKRCPIFSAFTELKDSDFQRRRLEDVKSSKFKQASDLIIATLQENGPLSGEELEQRVVTDEISQHTYQRARASLTNSRVIVMQRDCNKHTTYSLVTD